MRKKNGFFAVRTSLALCLILACVLWAFGQYPVGGARRTVSGPEDLRNELLWAQVVAPPGGIAAFAYDAGVFAFTPGDGAEELAGGLVSETDASGVESWPVALYEDSVSRDTVFLNGAGREVFRLAPPPGYDSAWVAAALYPDGVSADLAAADYDPARVVMTAVLVPPGAGFSSGGNGGVPSGASAGSGSAVPGAGTGSPSAGAASAASSAKEAKAASLATVTLPDDSASSASSGAATNSPSAPLRPVRAVPARTVYVDRANGLDAWTGLRPGASASDGPKRTVRAGLAAARKSGGGNRLVVRGGAYGESLNVRGLAVSVRAEGNVVLAAVSASSSTVSSSVTESYTSATGTVASVAN